MCEAKRLQSAIALASFVVPFVPLFFAVRGSVFPCPRDEAHVSCYIIRPMTRTEMFYYNRMHQPSFPAVYVHPSRIDGQGAFAGQDLRIGDMIEHGPLSGLINDAAIDRSWTIFNQSTNNVDALLTNTTVSALFAAHRQYLARAIALTNVRMVSDASHRNRLLLEVIQAIPKDQELLRLYSFECWLERWRGKFAAPTDNVVCDYVSQYASSLNRNMIRC